MSTRLVNDYMTSGGINFWPMQAKPSKCTNIPREKSAWSSIPLPLAWVVSSHPFPERPDLSQPHILAVHNFQLVQTSKCRVPVIDLHSKMDQQGLDKVRGLADVNLPGAKMRLELATGHPCDGVSAKNLPVPALGALPVR